MSRAEAAATAAAMFAALGDPTRLVMVERLAKESGQSIVALAKGTSLTRQAIARHLQVLERAELVESHWVGREKLYALRPERVDTARTYLAAVAAIGARRSKA